MSALTDKLSLLLAQLKSLFLQIFLPINAQTGTSYTLSLSDAGGIVKISNASANSVTIPPNSGVAFPIGSQVYILQGGAGATTIAAGAGVTIAPSTAIIGAQSVMVAAIQITANNWVVQGIPVNLHSPGPIGDTTPAPLFGTTLGINNTLTIDASVNTIAIIDVNPGGINLLEFRFGGVDYADLGAFGFQLNGGGAFYAFNGPGPSGQVGRYFLPGNACLTAPASGQGGLASANGVAESLIWSSTLISISVPIKLPSYTVATLPAASVGSGSIAFATDLLTPTFGSVAVGGGAVKGIVFSTGTTWNT